jgi:NADH-quinone oxidoreductase subunit H
MVELFKNQLFFSTILTVVVGSVTLLGVAYCIYFERKIAGWVQDRYGPNRVGWRGIFQPIADGLKFFLKEDIIPDKVDKPLYIVAPAITFVVALITLAVIPWGGWVDIDGNGTGVLDINGDGIGDADVMCQVASLDIGLLYILGVASMGVYGVVLGGWASNNKYSLYGALRATAQMLSYEIPMGLAILAVVLSTGYLRLEDVILAQTGDGNCWTVVKHPIAFFLLWIAAVAETNRLPFDLAEAEQELVSGYLTEYSSMKFALYFLGEYAHMIIGSAFIAVLFLGGWHLPWVPGLQPGDTSIWAMLFKMVVLGGKIAFFIFAYMMIRWTLPRFRFDQLMRLAWQKLIPLGLGAVAVAVVVVLIRGRGMPLWQEILLCWAGNAVVLVVAVIASLWARSRGLTITGRQENLPSVSVRGPAAGL